MSEPILKDRTRMHSNKKNDLGIGLAEKIVDSLYGIRNKPSLDHRSDLFYFGVKSRLVCSSLFRFGFNSSPKLRTLLRPESDYEKTRVAISC